MRTAHPAADAECAAGQTVAAAALPEGAAAAATATAGAADRRLAGESLTDLLVELRSVAQSSFLRALVHRVEAEVESVALVPSGGRGERGAT